jgi:hypothetical protein
LQIQRELLERAIFHLRDSFRWPFIPAIRHASWGRALSQLTRPAVVPVRRANVGRCNVVAENDCHCSRDNDRS